MPKHRVEDFRAAILRSVFWQTGSPTAKVASDFGVSRQAVQRHLRALIQERKLRVRGKAPHHKYFLATLGSTRREYRLGSGIAEDQVWHDIAAKAGGLSAEETDSCLYGLTEIVNNAIEHSAGQTLIATMRRTATSVEMAVSDDGMGVFEKISRALKLADPRESVLELSKGKLTTDPRHHTGEGIFFTSRVFDRFKICSGDLCLTRTEARQEWAIHTVSPAHPGTRVELALLLPAARTLVDVFTQFSSGPDEYRFSKTHVPLHLAQIGDQSLMSRSQARRVLARVERFDEVLLDFAGVRTVGQGFADEVFRVFANAHPKVRLVPKNVNPAVRAMIQRALSARMV